MPREASGTRGGRSERRARGPEASPETIAQALDRARGHARRAVGEALAAVRALLDAASLGWSGRPSDAHAALRGISDLLDEQSRRFAEGDGAVPAAVLEAILGALDQEIARWEARALSDADARAVLRTFLGLREILWEFGLRRQEPSASAATRSPVRGAPDRKPRSASGEPESGERRVRVQRVDVQG